MQRFWFTADLHFDHDNIRIHCNRPFKNLDEMHSTIIKNWNSVVSKKDIVYILGDFAYSKHSHWLMRLNGKKILIKGNHDDMSLKDYRNFTEVTPLKDIKINGNKITLCHYPMMSWNCSHFGAWHLYGHVHGRVKHKSLAMDVGIDTHDFYPYSYEEISEMMAKKYIFIKSNEYILFKSLNGFGGLGVKSIFKTFNDKNILHTIWNMLRFKKNWYVNVVKVQGHIESDTYKIFVEEDENGKYFVFLNYKNYIKDFLGYEKL